MFQKARILIVEDEEVNALHLQETVRHAGHTIVAVVDSGETAMRVIESDMPDVVLMDVQLAGDLDGIETTARIRARVDIPVIFLTAFSDQNLIERLAATTPYSYLLKPFHAKELEIAIEIALYKHQMETELRTVNRRLAQEINDFQRSEAALQVSLEKYRVLFESLPLGITITDRQGNILETNQTAERLLGLSRAEYTRRQIDSAAWQIVRRDETPMPAEEYASVRALKENRVIANLEAGVVKENGDITWINVTAAPIPLAGYGVVIAYSDITERRHVENLVRKLMTAIEILPLGLTITDLDGTILYTNPTEAEMHGYHLEELLGKKANMLAPPELRKPLTLEQIQDWRGLVRESTNMRKDGHLFPVWLMSEIVADPHGRPTALVTTCQDITERKQAEQNLAQSAAQYRALIEHVTDGLAIIQDDRIVFVNHAFANILALTADELIGKRPPELFDAEHRAHFDNLLDRLNQGVFNDTQHIRAQLADRREIWLEEQHSLITWAARPAVVMSLRDITRAQFRELEFEAAKNQLTQLNAALQSTVQDRYRFGDLIGKSQAIQHVYHLIVNAATSDANVVIYGESGTGKELVAQTIHRLSVRHQHALVAVNCGAIQETLFESEFFGHRKGAFTGAVSDKDGLFDIARGGSLFLDELEALTPVMQAKLLRAIEGSGYLAVGGTTLKTAEVRIIAATNQRPSEQIQQGTLRKDFFYRLYVIAINLPALRERREDIPLLIDYFWDKFRGAEQASRPSGKILKALYEYDWPGNVRELQNTIQRLLVTGRLEFLGFNTELHLRENGSPQAAATAPEDVRDTIAANEANLIRRALERHHGNHTKAAADLGLTRRSFIRRLEKYGLKSHAAS